MKKLILIIFTSFFMVGCSTSIPINYVPAPVIKGEGNVWIGEATYTASELGKVKNNEMQKATGAIGYIYTTTPIAEIVKKSLQKELISAGYTVNELADLKIDIVVDKFLYDWRGIVEVDFYIDVTFTVTKNGNKIMVYSAKSHQAAPKTVNMDSEAIRTALSSVFSDFMIEARNKKVL